MARKTVKRGLPERWAETSGVMRKLFPQVSSWWGQTDSFNRLKLLSRADGTVLAVASGFGSDGGPVVCFGSGYGVSAALMALDASMAGNNWKVEKPWTPPK